MNAAIRRTCSGGDNRPCIGREAVDPIARENRLAGFLVRAEGSPVAFLLIFFVRNGSLDDKNKRCKFAIGCLWKWLMNSSPFSYGRNGLCRLHFGNPWHGTEDKVFDTGLSRRRHGDGVAIASKPRGNPEHVNFRNRLWSLRGAFSNLRGISHSIFAPAKRGR